MNTAHKQIRQHQHPGVYNQRKNPQCKEVERQGNQYQKRTDKQVDHRQNGPSQNTGKKIVHPDGGKNQGRRIKGSRIYKKLQDIFFHIKILFLAQKQSNCGVAF